MAVRRKRKTTAKKRTTKKRKTHKVRKTRKTSTAKKIKKKAVSFKDAIVKMEKKIVKKIKSL